MILARQIGCEEAMANALQVSPLFLNDMAFHYFLDNIPRLGPVIKMTVDSGISVLKSGLISGTGLCWCFSGPGYEFKYRRGTANGATNAVA
jgi:hypothetical protein